MEKVQDLVATPADFDDDPRSGARSTHRRRRTRVPVAQAYVPSGRFISTAPEFFGQLGRAGLPDAMRSPIGGALTVLLEEDDEDKELAPPNLASFSGLLSFLVQHPDLSVPSIGVNPAGLFVSTWQDRAFRFSLEFPPSAGAVWWAHIEKRPEKTIVEDGWPAPNN